MNVPVRFVEEALRRDGRFDAETLLSGHPSRADRLRYWTNDMCRTDPQRFDFVLTVRSSTPTSHRFDAAWADGAAGLARRRRHGLVRQLAVPTGGAAGAVVRAGVSGLPYQIRLRPFPRDARLGLPRRHHRQLASTVRGYDHEIARARRDA